MVCTYHIRISTRLNNLTVPLNPVNKICTIHRTFWTIKTLISIISHNIMAIQFENHRITIQFPIMHIKYQNSFQLFILILVFTSKLHLFAHDCLFLKILPSPAYHNIPQVLLFSLSVTPESPLPTLLLIDHWNISSFQSCPFYFSTNFFFQQTDPLP